MRSLPGRGAFGLRGRIVGAVLFTTVATLAVAALALLGPLEQSLHNAERTTLQKDLDRKTVSQFTGLELGRLVTSARARSQLSRARTQLQDRIGATVSVWGYPGVNGADSEALTTIDDDGGYGDVATAFRTGRPRYTFASIDGREYARAAIPFQDGGLRYVLAVRKPTDEIAGAVAVVRRAFLDAVLAGLALTLILGIPLSARLVRRLQRLRQAALELTHEGPGVKLPVDRARDEVGDLARSLATMQQRLRQQEEARRAFVATASHELRTPLTSLDGMLELLDDDLRYEQPDLDDARALVVRARAQSRRLGRLAADLLDLSRIDAQIDLRSEPVELGELGRAVLAEFELGTHERDVATALVGPDTPVWALGDPGSIARVLRILLDNAVRFSPPGSTITVGLRQAALVGVSVSDQGPGVPGDERDAIFLRFHRGRETGGQGGFGLGLAIGRELAERMGGALVLEDAAGSGATFRLDLPPAAPPADDAVDGEWPAPEPVPAATRSGRRSAGS
ncbi:MAG: HAMP domain-containing sensor histidine kinase [Solirubrobacteraceae bacterium]